MDGFNSPPRNYKFCLQPDLVMALLLAGIRSELEPLARLEDFLFVMASIDHLHCSLP
jgi:hypothetical protein